MKPCKYVVTGCAGFIGSHLTEALLEAGHEVKGIDNFSEFYSRTSKEQNMAGFVGHEGFELVEANLWNSPLASAFSWADGVFHLAAQPGVRGSWGDSFRLYVRDNVTSTQRVFETALRYGIPVVYASSSSVYGNAAKYPTDEGTPLSPLSPYGVTKMTCDALAEAYRAQGLSAVGLRYFTVYGPRQRPDMAFRRMIHAMLTHHTFEVLGDGHQSRDFTFVGDAVEATIRAMRADADGALNGVVNIGGGNEASLLEVVGIVRSLSWEPLEIVRGQPAPGDVRRTCADHSLAYTVLGWKPKMPLREGLAAQLEWQKASL